ncbi:MAG TPA: hypothetical protein VK324_06100 [Tepidisphaeraceae bacterium]|nr:hypothetical protein [Tepidisphaeraceae bacterium]
MTPRPLAAASFDWADDFVRVWYVSEDGNFALVTYLCRRTRVRAPELADAEAIVRSLMFGNAGHDSRVAIVPPSP